MTELAYDIDRSGDVAPYCPDGYALRIDGLYRLSSGRQSEEKISGPITVIAFTKNVNTDTFGFVLKWTDIDGKEQDHAFPRDWLHDQGFLLAKVLANRGLELIPGKEKILQRYLGSFDPKKVDRVQAAGQLGWVDTRDGQLAFVLPNQTIQSGDGNSIFFQPEEHSPTTLTMRESGSLDDWNTNIARKCIGNPYLLFAMATALAGPLLKPARLESGGIHFFGQSSRGKTTAAQVAASVWGCGADPADAPDRSYLQRWNATANALEGLSAAHNDGILVLDEIHTCSAKDFGGVVYNLFGGKGKNTLTRDRQLRTPRTWRLLCLSTGEISSQQKIEETQSRANAGQLLRMIDIPINDAVIICTHGLEAQAFVKALKRSCGEYYGTAGPAFISAVIDRYAYSDSLCNELRHSMDAIRETLDFESQSPEQQRVADRFSLIAAAGELAIALDILDIPPNVFINATQALYRTWCASDTNIPDSVRGAIALKRFLLRHQSRFVSAQHFEGMSSIRDIAGYTDRDRHGNNVFLLLPAGFEEAVDGFDRNSVANELRNLRLLITSENDRYQTKRTIQGQRVRVYAIRGSILSHEFTNSTGLAGRAGQVVDNAQESTAPLAAPQ